jgi:hypothetical protein
MVTRYSPEQRAEIYAAAEAAIEAAQAAIDAPRAELPSWPPVEDRVAKWKREAAEQEQRFARERAEPWPLTEYEQAQQQRDELTRTRMIDEERDFTKRLLAGVVAELRAEHSEEFDVFANTLQERLVDKIADLITDELDKFRREMSNNNKSGEIIDLPMLPLVRKERRG